MATKKSTKSANEEQDVKGLSQQEIAAMKERLQEVKAEKRGKKADGEADLLAKVADMPEPERTMATRIHQIVKESAPNLTSKTWYGMPAYANKDGKVVCFFQSAAKFEARYATFGFNDTANLDDGAMWAVSYALIELTPAVEEKLRAAIKKAVS